MAGEGDGTAELTKSTRPADARAREERRRDHRQRDPAQQRPAVGSERAGRILEAAVHATKTGLNGQDQKGHGDEGLSHYHTRHRKRQPDAEELVEPLPDESAAAERE